MYLHLRRPIGIVATSIALCLTVTLPALGQAGEITAGDGSVMVLVPAGPFVMGTGQGEDYEAPPHRVELPAYYIDKTEVTCTQYARYLKETDAQPPAGWDGPQPPAGSEALPITNITWFQAMQYAIWAGKRLPTEAEWEKAARGTDGRTYPWGNMDDREVRNLPDHSTDPRTRHLMAVDSLPQGASPYGCLNMGGNAWEWTATWFDVYPGSEAHSVHFGHKYKVMRGGGAINFYGVANTPKTTQRARLVPYGAHDFLGFRCVKDVDPADAPYDAEASLARTRERIADQLKKPRVLNYEKELAMMKETARVPIKIVGSEGQKGLVRTGFPLPEDFNCTIDEIAVINSQGQSVPVQTAVLSTWPKGQPRWVLLDFAAQAGETCNVTWARGTDRPQNPQPIYINKNNDVIAMGNGLLNIELTADELIRRIDNQEQATTVGPLSLTMRTDAGPLHLLPAESMEIEEQGPLHGVVRLQGFFADDQGKQTPFKYDLRVHLTDGAQQVRMLLTVTHYADREPVPGDNPWAEALPVTPVKQLGVRFILPDVVRQASFATEEKPQAIEVGPAGAVLNQLDDLSYAIEQRDEKVFNGTRAPGWVSAKIDNRTNVTLGVRHFWQNYPKALVIRENQIGADLWTGPEPFLWEAGLAKTHELVLEFEPAGRPAIALDPMRAIFPPAWACGTGAAYEILPRDTESLTLFPYWELWRQTDMLEWVVGRAYGFRHFGDAYYGGPYKGKNAYVNLEYDVHLNMLMQFLRTGELWYFNTAEASARHQSDIDFNNYSGMIFKHSPRHTTHEADMGHVFVRGLLLQYQLTGERRLLEMAEKAGDWIASEINGAMVGGGKLTNAIGNERKIGWSLYAMSALYDVTKKKKYLDAAEKLCNKLVSEQGPTGQFNIEWDNRIAFFNGIAMNGMLSVNEINNDPKLEAGILKLAYRTLGHYPEYALRTMNAFCWALKKTDDPAFLDAMQRVWDSSMGFFQIYRCSTSLTHAWKFPRFAARYRLFPLFEETPADLPQADSWRAYRLKTSDPQVMIEPTGHDTAAVMVLRESPATGTVELLDGAGQLLHSVELNEANEYFEPAVFELPPGDIYRLRMRSADGGFWQVHYDGRARAVVYDHQYDTLPDLLPRAYGYVEPGADKVHFTFTAEGEGFHSAVLYDPQGRPVKALRFFIDLGDTRLYPLELEAEVSGDRAGWSIESQKLEFTGVEGMLPYWSNDPDQLFSPEKKLADPQP